MKALSVIIRILGGLSIILGAAVAIRVVQYLAPRASYVWPPNNTSRWLALIVSIVYSSKVILPVLGGIGLLALKEWGRKTILVYSKLQIILFIVLVVISVFMSQSFHGLHTLRAAFSIQLQIVGGTGGLNWLSPLEMAYAVVALIVLNLKSIKKQTL